MSEKVYVGTELELFSQARKWKGYLGSILKKYLRGRVLEVGAGMGAMTSVLCDGTQEYWLCLEPDPRLSAILESKIKEGGLPPCCAVKNGTISELATASPFNVILYVDVVEHIYDGKQELEEAVQRLSSGGFLAIVAPAHMALYSTFDSGIGHFRRYTKEMLTTIVPAALEVKDLRYLDSMGFFCSLGNRYLLKRTTPTATHISIWDKVLIPFSRLIDPLMGYTFGRSIVAVWQYKPE